MVGLHNVLYLNYITLVLRPAPAPTPFFVLMVPLNFIKEQRYHLWWIETKKNIKSNTFYTLVMNHYLKFSKKQSLFNHRMWWIHQLKGHTGSLKFWHLFLRSSGNCEIFTNYVEAVWRENHRNVLESG